MVFDWQSGGDVRHNISEHHTSALQNNQTPAVACNISGGSKRQYRPEGGFYVTETVTSKTLDGTGLSGEKAQGGTVVAFQSAQNGGTGKGDGAPVFAWHDAQITSPQNSGGVSEVLAPTLNGDSRSMVCVRRLTPTECERLQGFPDGWTAVGQSDSARYRQLGNAVAVPVIEWIGRRIIAVEESQ